MGSRRRTALLTGTGLMLSVATLAGCGSGASSPTNNSTSNTTSVNAGTPVDGGTITMGMTVAPKGDFNPIYYEDLYTAYVLGMAFDTLVQQNGDTSLRAGLANSWELSADKKTITFHLRKDAKWQDGQPVTADDVAFTYNSIAQKDYAGPRFNVVSNIVGSSEVKAGKATTMSGIKVIDPYTISITTKRANPAEINTLNFYIIPKHIFEKIPVSQWPNAVQSTTNIIGDGPYQITKIVPGQSFELTANPTYWGGKPHIQKVVWKVVDASVAPGLLQNGELDVLYGVSPKDVDSVKSNGKDAIYEAPAFGYSYIGFKLNEKKLQNLQLRQAMMYAIDRKGIVAGLLKGHGTVINAPFAPTSWAAAPASDLNPYPYDPTKSAQMLDAAGYKKGADGWRTQPDGTPLSITLDYSSGSPVLDQEAPIVTKQLQAVGIHAILNPPHDFNTLVTNMEKDKVDMWFLGWSLATDPDPEAIWLSTAKFNFEHYVNPQSDQLIQDGISLQAFDQAYRKEVYVKWQELLNHDVPMIYLYSANNIYAYNTRIQGIDPTPVAFSNYHYQNWWIPKDKQ